MGDAEQDKVGMFSGVVHLTGAITRVEARKTFVVSLRILDDTTKQ